jgi:hypothetical protein
MTTFKSVATVVAVATGLIIFNAVPVIIGGLVARSGIDEATSTSLVTTEFLAIALTTVLAARGVAHRSLRDMAIGGACVTAAAQLASAFLAGNNGSVIAVYFVLRTLAGTGEGMLLCAGNAALARSLNATRLYAVAMIASSLCSAFFFTIVPGLQMRWSGAAFAVLGVVALLATPFLRHLETLPALVSDFTGIPQRGNVWGRLLSLSSAFLFSVSLAALWAFSELIGTRLGLSRELAGQVLAANLIAGLGGAGLAAVLDNRFGHTLPFVVGAIVLGCVALILGSGHTILGYIGAEAAYGAAYPFAVTFLMASFAARDSSGKLVAAAGGVILVGFAIGPAAGAVAVAQGGFPTLGIAVCVGILGSLALCLRRTARARHQLLN